MWHIEYNTSLTHVISQVKYNFAHVCSLHRAHHDSDPYPRCHLLWCFPSRITQHRLKQWTLKKEMLCKKLSPTLPRCSLSKPTFYHECLPGCSLPLFCMTWPCSPGEWNTTCTLGCSNLSLLNTKSTLGYSTLSLLNTTSTLGCSTLSVEHIIYSRLLYSLCWTRNLL